MSYHVTLFILVVRKMVTMFRLQVPCLGCSSAQGFLADNCLIPSNLLPCQAPPLVSLTGNSREITVAHTSEKQTFCEFDLSRHWICTMFPWLSISLAAFGLVWTGLNIWVPKMGGNPSHNRLFFKTTIELTPIDHGILLDGVPMCSTMCTKLETSRSFQEFDARGSAETGLSFSSCSSCSVGYVLCSRFAIGYHVQSARAC